MISLRIRAGVARSLTDTIDVELSLPTIAFAVQRLHLLTDLFGGKVAQYRLRHQTAEQVNTLTRIGSRLGLSCLAELLAQLGSLGFGLRACLFRATR